MLDFLYHIITSVSVTQPVRKTEFDHSSSTTSVRADSASLEGTTLTKSLLRVHDTAQLQILGVCFLKSEKFQEFTK